MGIKTYRPVTAGLRHRTGSTFEELTTDSPHKPLLKSLSEVGRAGQPRPALHPQPGRRPQEALPDHRFQAGQDRHPGRRRDHRVRPEPLGVHLPRQVPGRRAPLHPLAPEPQGRPGDRLLRRPGRHPPGQRHAPAVHPPRHDHPQHRDEEGQGRPDRQVRRDRGPDPGQGRGLRPGPPAVVRDPEDPPGLPGDDRPDRQPGPPEHRHRQGRARAAGWAGSPTSAARP